MAYKESALTEDMGTCYLCGRVAQQMHHIFNGPERAKSTADNMIIPVCAGCHERIHNDAALRRELKAIGQIKWEWKYINSTFGDSDDAFFRKSNMAREAFRKRYGKSYL